MRAVNFVITGFAAATLCLAQVSGGKGTSKSAAKTEPAETIYKRQCAGCHGTNGNGQTSMGKVFKLQDLGSADVQKMTDDQLFDVIARGKGKMPAYENNLGHENIHNLVKYLRQFGSKSK